MIKDDEEKEVAFADSAKSPMPGTVAKIFVKVGQKIKKGDTIAAVESMKMEYAIKADHDATVSEIAVKEGQFVEMKQRLMSFT